MYQQALMWRARKPASRHMARETSARIRRGSEATWQGRGVPHAERRKLKAWPRGEGPRDNAAPRGAPVRVPRGREVCIWRAHGTSGPWLEFGGGNANALSRPNIYSRQTLLFLPCETMSHTLLTICR